MPNPKRVFPCCLLGILLVLTQSPTRAEMIELRDGRLIEGKVLVVTKIHVGIETTRGRVTLPREGVKTPDLAKRLKDAHAAMGRDDFARAAGLCDGILVWDSQYPGADVMRNRARATLLENQAKALSDAQAQAHAEKLSRDVETAAREEAERLRIAHEKATAVQRMKDSKLKEARELFESGDRAGALEICREILVKAPDDPQITTLLTHITAVDKRARESLLPPVSTVIPTKPKLNVLDMVEGGRSSAGGGLNPWRIERIQDPAVKQAVQEIQTKLAAFKEYTCVINHIFTSVGNDRKGEMESKINFSFRLPNFSASILTFVKTPVPGQTGSTVVSLMDGKTYWTYITHAPGSGLEQYQPLTITLEQMQNQEIRERILKQNQEIKKRAKEHEKPVLFKMDMQRIKGAGFSVEAVVSDNGAFWHNGVLLKPFDLCDFASLKLVEQDETKWVFMANSAPLKGVKPKSTYLLTVNKNDGLLQKFNRSYTQRGTKVVEADTFTDIKLNPGLPDSTFVAQLPADIQATDLTDTTIQQLSKPAVP